MFVIFDLLRVEGRHVTRRPYRERGLMLATLGLEGPQWCVPDAFEDGLALWDAVCEQGLEGVVAKRIDRPYVPGERGWVKVKNRDYWRYELEREGAIRSRTAV